MILPKRYCRCELGGDTVALQWIGTIQFDFFIIIHSVAVGIGQISTCAQFVFLTVGEAIAIVVLVAIGKRGGR